jgi:cadmium resistance protein CadD (predicted permease)
MTCYSLTSSFSDYSPNEANSYTVNLFFWIKLVPFSICSKPFPVNGKVQAPNRTGQVYRIKFKSDVYIFAFCYGKLGIFIKYNNGAVQLISAFRTMAGCISFIRRFPSGKEH